LDYGYAEPRIYRAWIWRPRFRRLTWTWLFLAVATCCYAWLHRGIWQIEYRIRAWPAQWSSCVSPDGGQVLLRAPRPRTTAEDVRMASPEHRNMGIWNVRTGEKLRTLQGDGIVKQAAWLLDGERVLTHHLGGSVILWDARNGHPITKIASSANGHELPFTCNPHGASFIVMDAHGRSQLRAADDGRLIEQFDHFTGSQFSADGSRAILFARIGPGDVIDARTGVKLESTVLVDFRSPNGPIEQHLIELGFSSIAQAGGALSPDGRLRITYPLSKGIPVTVLQDRVTGQTIRNLDPRSRAIDGAAFSPDGTRVACSGAGDRIFVSNLTNNQNAQAESAAKASMDHGMWSHDSQRLLLVHPWNGFEIWDKDLRGCEAVVEQERGEESDMSGNVTWAGSKRFITSDTGGGVAIWSIRRPTAWWGVVCLWQLWLAVIVVVVTACHVRCDLRRWFAGV